MAVGPINTTPGALSGLGNDAGGLQPPSDEHANAFRKLMAASPAPQAPAPQAPAPQAPPPEKKTSPFNPIYKGKTDDDLSARLDELDKIPVAKRTDGDKAEFDALATELTLRGIVKDSIVQQQNLKWR
jgi:hypothetical protein